MMINEVKQIINDYVGYWKSMPIATDSAGPYIHPCDEKDLNGTKASCFRARDKHEYDKVTCSEMVHVDLLPSPYMGDIENAKVLIFMNNPGIGKQERFDKHHKENQNFLGEYNDFERSDLREALIDTLHQQFSNPEHSDYRFAFLNPKFKDTEGGRYIFSKLAKCIEKFNCSPEAKLRDGLKVFANSICFFQMYPYHTGNKPSKYQSMLNSHKRALDFYQTILPKIYDNEDILILVVRGHKHVINFLPESKAGYYFNIKGAPNRARFSFTSDGCFGDKLVQHLIKYGKEKH